LAPLARIGGESNKLTVSIEQVFDDPDLAAEAKKGLHFTLLSEPLPHFAICYRRMYRAGKKKRDAN
jgi:hypothetical protein